MRLRAPLSSVSFSANMVLPQIWIQVPELVALLYSKPTVESTPWVFIYSPNRRLEISEYSRGGFSAFLFAVAERSHRVEYGNDEHADAEVTPDGCSLYAHRDRVRTPRVTFKVVSAAESNGHMTVVRRKDKRSEVIPIHFRRLRSLSKASRQKENKTWLSPIGATAMFFNAFVKNGALPPDTAVKP